MKRLTPQTFAMISGLVLIASGIVLISTEFSCASRTLMHETGYGPDDRLGGRFHFLVFDPGTEFDRTAQAYFGLSPRRDGFDGHARSP